MLKKLTITLLITAMISAAFPMRTQASGIDLADDVVNTLIGSVLTAGGITFNTLEDAVGLMGDLLRSEEMYPWLDFLEDAAKLAVNTAGQFARIPIQTAQGIWSATADFFRRRGVSEEVTPGPIHVPEYVINNLFMGLYHGVPVFADGFHDLTANERRLIFEKIGRVDTVTSIPYFFNQRHFFHSWQLEWQTLAGIEYISDLIRFGNARMHTVRRGGRFYLQQEVEPNQTNDLWWDVRCHGFYIIKENIQRGIVYSTITGYWENNTTLRIGANIRYEPYIFKSDIEKYNSNPSFDFHLMEANLLNRLDELNALIHTLSGTLDEILLRIPDNLSDLLGQTAETVIIHHNYFNQNPEPTPSPPPAVCDGDDTCVCDETAPSETFQSWWAQIRTFANNLFETIPQQVSGYTSFLATALAVLPAEVHMAIAFMVLLMVAAGVIKILKR
ncbi:MAG: hypothetical protein FWE90_08275 [Defluviitaleaceae bacterium]|nr:hypothetical protein [Defluviitaleaceae bacterium]